MRECGAPRRTQGVAQCDRGRTESPPVDRRVLGRGGVGLRRQRIFEISAANRWGSEPRAFEAGDLDGDGRNDLAVLCHDRILVYLQEK